MNHSKQFLQTSNREITANSAYKLLLESHLRHHLKSITELIPNKAYKLLFQKSFKMSMGWWAKILASK